MEIAIIASIFFFENAQILLSSAALLKTKFEGVSMFLIKMFLNFNFDVD